jgi:hypothetical protein
MPVIEIFVLLFSLVALRAVWDYRKRRGRPYPPGPRPLPLIGNFFDIPKDFSWLAYTEYSKKYGMTIISLGVIQFYNKMSQVISRPSTFLDKSSSF